MRVVGDVGAAKPTWWAQWRKTALVARRLSEAECSPAPPVSVSGILSFTAFGRLILPPNFSQHPGKFARLVWIALRRLSNFCFVHTLVIPTF